MGGAPPIFLYSGFRAASTWLWTRFRRDPACWAYYEIFHEGLATARADDLRRQPNPEWRSHHPAGDPYFLEFLPLVSTAGGIAGFPAEKQLAADFIPAGGLDATLDPRQARYIDGLIAAARALERVPVLTCTRMLGRIAAIRAAVPGFHILLERNLYRQWNSYAGQHRSGNMYFIHMLRLTVLHGRDDPFLAHLHDRLPAPMQEDGATWVEERYYDETFVTFAALHVYLLIHARRFADLVIDVDRLADAADAHRAACEAAIRAATGLAIDLGGARDEIDLPRHMVADPAAAAAQIEALVAIACDMLRADAGERTQAAAMLAALWREHDRFALYSRAARESLKEAARDTSAAAAQGRGAWRQMEFHVARSARLEAELLQLRNQVTRMGERLDASVEDGAEVERRLGETASALHAAERRAEGAVAARQSAEEQTRHRDAWLAETRAELAALRVESDRLEHQLREAREAPASDRPEPVQTGGWWRGLVALARRLSG